MRTGCFLSQNILPSNSFWEERTSNTTGQVWGFQSSQAPGRPQARGRGHAGLRGHLCPPCFKEHGAVPWRSGTTAVTPVAANGVQEPEDPDVDSGPTWTLARGPTEPHCTQTQHGGGLRHGDRARPSAPPSLSLQPPPAARAHTDQPPASSRCLLARSVQGPRADVPPLLGTDQASKGPHGPRQGAQHIAQCMRGTGGGGGRQGLGACSVF